MFRWNCERPDKPLYIAVFQCFTVALLVSASQFIKKRYISGNLFPIFDA